MAVTVAFGIFQFIGNVMPPEDYWPSSGIHFPFFGLISSSSPCFASPYHSLSFSGTLKCLSDYTFKVLITSFRLDFYDIK